MIEQYLSQVNKKETNPKLVSFRSYATEHNVPIIREDGMAFLIQILQLTNAKRVLEIGTAIGFSAIQMALKASVEVVSIERDDTMYQQALQNIEAMNLKDKITVIHQDALLVDETTLGHFDVIFIDAAKSQSIKFFEKFSPLLQDKGVIVTDNLVFHGLVVAEIKDRNLKQLVRKIKTFNEYVVAQEEYDTYIYNVGDGMSVSIKRT